MVSRYDYFHQFTNDIMELCLHYYGHNTDEFSGPRMIVPVIGTIGVFSQAVYYYRESHREIFEEILKSYHGVSFVDITQLPLFIRFGILKITKDDSIFMDLIRMMAFYLDLMIYCQRFENPKDFVRSISKCSTEIFDYLGIDGVCIAPGSYRFLKRVAIEVMGVNDHLIRFRTRVKRWKSKTSPKPQEDRAEVGLSLSEEAEGISPSLEREQLSGLEAIRSAYRNAAEPNDDFSAPSTSGTQKQASSSTVIEKEESEYKTEIRYDFCAPSTSGTQKQASSSTNIEKEESEFKKKRSILKNPYEKPNKKQKTTNTNEQNKVSTNKTKRPIGPCHDKWCRTHCLIYISDTLSPKQKVSLDKILEEIFHYNEKIKPLISDGELEISEETLIQANESNLKYKSEY